MANATAKIMWLQAFLRELQVPGQKELAYGETTWVSNIYHQIQFFVVE
jgi:hypothetical protein